MVSTDYERLREGILRDLEAKIAEEDELARKLAEVKQEIQGLRTISAGLDVYLGDPKTSEDTWGITDAIRDILDLSSPDAMKPTDIRDKLRILAFAIDDYSQPLAVVHTTLKRLENQKEVESVEKDGSTLYRRIEVEDIPF